MLFKTWYAFFILIPLFVIFIWKWFQRKKNKGTLFVSSVQEMKKIRPSWRVYLSRLSPVLKGLSLVLIVVALARPQKQDVKVQRTVDGIDIVIALDISDSMLIEDMPPAQNRLESAKATIEKFIRKRSSDRIGLIVFSGESYTRVPLTLDYQLLTQSLESVQVSRNVKMGTALGVALANSVARLKGSKAKSRVVIFLTDGENNSGTIDPETALEIAKGYGIKIYTIGIGRDGKTRLPVISKDVFGRQVKRYQAFYSKVNEELLSKMAEETGGQFYRATSSDLLNQVFNDINSLEKSQVEAEKYFKYEELFPFWLKLSVLFYLISFLFDHVFLRRGP